MNEGSKGKKILLYACSGAADVGEVADRVIRRLRADKTGTMSCIGALGAGEARHIENAQSADGILVIDGCPVQCGKKIFGKLGIPATCIELSELGLEKGKTPVTDEIIQKTAERIKEKFAREVHQ